MNMNMTMVTLARATMGMTVMANMTIIPMANMNKVIIGQVRAQQPINDLTCQKVWLSSTIKGVFE